jgi:hypothetical protein
VASLERQQRKLIRRIARKQKQAADVETGCRELGARVMAHLEPLMERGRRANADIHAMFRKILTTRKLGKRSYRSIFGLYHGLQEVGLISTQAFEPERTDAQSELFEEYEPQIPDTPDTPDTPDMPDTEDADEWHLFQPVQSRGPRSGSFRDIFLQLAGRFHPDLATDADLQHQHTEIMKELNRAYREGDVARLLEMKRELDSRGTVEPAALSPEEHCARLLEQIAQLKEQLRSVDQHLTSLRDSPMGALLMEYRRLLQMCVDNPIDLYAEEVEEQIAAIEEIARFVRQFHDGKMTIKRFLRGPASLASFQDEIPDEILIEILDDQPLGKRSRSRRRR